MCFLKRHERAGLYLLNCLFSPHRELAVNFQIVSVCHKCRSVDLNVYFGQLEVDNIINSHICIMSDKDYSPLSSYCVRALNDKLYEKRKTAALEIEK